MPHNATTRPTEAHVVLYWLPLGAGARVVAFNGRVFEALESRTQHRAPLDLYHSALKVHVGGESFAIEMTPVWGNGTGDRGVVQEGPVGSRWLGWSPLFRYEVRRWREGAIPDAAYAVCSPRRVGHDLELAQRLLDLVPRVPSLTWGRDELGLGEMWNSNSLTSWLLASSGHDLHDIAPPSHGRAPGWAAGIAAARAHLTADASGRAGAIAGPVQGAP